MRKYYVEKYSFYRFLEDLNSLPFGACTTPLYYNRRFDFIDVYVIFMQDEISPPAETGDAKKTQIGAFFYRKPKDVRRSSQVVPICQVWAELSEIIELVLCPQVRFVNDMLNALGKKYTEIYTALEDACKFDTQT